MSGNVADSAISPTSPAQTIPADLSGQMLELDEDDDLEVFSKVYF